MKKQVKVMAKKRKTIKGGLRRGDIAKISASTGLNYDVVKNVLHNRYANVDAELAVKAAVKELKAKRKKLLDKISKK